MKIDFEVSPKALKPLVDQAFASAAIKSADLAEKWDGARGTPVFTVNGQYTTRGWTEWTQGFQYGILLLAGEGVSDTKLVDLGRKLTFERMLPHVTHIGVHDHGFNNLSSYGNLLRLVLEKNGLAREADRTRCRDLLAVSGAIQAARWSEAADGDGYIYSFNGPQSLFIDTMRTLRIVVLAHQLGHYLAAENDRKINLLERALRHSLTTDRRIVFHGNSSHGYDVRGRTAHEGVFNKNDGAFRTRSTQQGYSPFSTWTRGSAWAVLGYAEQSEFLATQTDSALPAKELNLAPAKIRERMLQAAIDTADHYINDVTALDGIPYWDDGAPQLHCLGDWQQRASEPYNKFEPIDSSAAAIAAQGLLRLGRLLGGEKGARYTQAGLTVSRTLLQEPYLSTSAKHQGLLLHSVYHWPNRWDHVPKGQTVTCNESSMWGDYHLLELALLLRRLENNGAYPAFFKLAE